MGPGEQNVGFEWKALAFSLNQSIDTVPVGAVLGTGALPHWARRPLLLKRGIMVTTIETTMASQIRCEDEMLVKVVTP